MAPRFTLRQLEYLVAVGETGSIVAAAERVNAASPSISTAIARLEVDFGLTLFARRHAHGLALTQAGRQMFQKAQAILAEAAQLQQLADALTGEVRGPLSVGCLVTFAQVVLPQLRRSFCTRFPQVDFRQSEQTQTEIFAGLRDGTLDVALTYDMEIPAELDFIALASLPPYAVLAPDHPLARLETVSPAELAAHPMVLLDLPISADYFLSFFTRIGLRPQIAERTRDMGVMRSLVANGFGYSIANIRPVSDLAPDGRRLRYVPLTGPVPPMRLGLALVQGAGRSLTVQSFIDHARASVTPETTPGLQLRLP